MALAGQAFALRLAAQNSFMRSDWASRASLDMPLRCRRGFVWGPADATVDFGGRPRCLGFDSASHFGGRPRRLGAPAARRENIRIASSMWSRSSWSSARVLLRSMFTEGYHVTKGVALLCRGKEENTGNASKFSEKLMIGILCLPQTPSVFEVRE